jgi:hypothetical protein
MIWLNLGKPGHLHCQVWAYAMIIIIIIMLPIKP